MSLFKKQPGFCCVCGEAGEYEPHNKMGFIHNTSDMKCMNEYNWRYTLYCRGKEYYPQPEKKNE